MGIFFSRPWLRVLSAFFTNLAAGWFTAVFITPTITDITSPRGLSILIRYLLSGIISLLISVKLEKDLER